MRISEILKDQNIREANISLFEENKWNVIYKDASFDVHEDIMQDSDLSLPKGVIAIGETPLVNTFSAPKSMVDEKSLNARVIVLKNHADGEIVYISISKTADPSFEEVSPFLHKLKGHKSIIFSGATGSGKTHMLNQFLYHHLPKDSTYFLIEEFEEINLPTILHKVHRSIPFAEPGDYLDYGPYYLNEANTSRVSGVIYGECKTPSVAEGLIMAANNGTDVYSTIHSANAVGAIKKLASLIFPNMSLDERLKMVANNIECVVHLENHDVKEIGFPTGSVVNGNVQMRMA